ncbi:MAG: hypothetical protein IPK63_20095 [Candidatus Competibacteraceae bacterium]|nr:hypothetical protein [Candidatus Competibacteraceae bacterium]
MGELIAIVVGVVIGRSLGGNGALIGTSANLAAAGFAERAGPDSLHPLSADRVSAHADVHRHQHSLSVLALFVTGARQECLRLDSAVS